MYLPEKLLLELSYRTLSVPRKAPSFPSQTVLPKDSDHYHSRLVLLPLNFTEMIYIVCILYLASFTEHYSLTQHEISVQSCLFFFNTHNVSSCEYYIIS